MNKILDILYRLFYRIEQIPGKVALTKLRHAGKHIFVGRSVHIEHPECVSLGDKVFLNDFCWISIVTENCEQGSPSKSLQPHLSIGDGTYIGRFGTLACVGRMTIGKNVLISDRAYIGDAIHGFSRTDIPIAQQYMTSTGPVEIGDGTWVGIGASILPNVKIGKNCVIGAGAVVTRDVPDFCVAVGVPAQVVRRIGAKQ
jgi:serine acetyltransferase